VNLDAMHVANDWHGLGWDERRRLARSQGRAVRWKRPARFLRLIVPTPPQDYWRHRSPAAECHASCGGSASVFTSNTGDPNSYEYV